MFPDQFSSFQGMAQIMALREMQKIRRDRKGSGEYKSFRYLIWFCLGKLGLGLSKFGRFLEQAGQRMAVLVMRKKVESFPMFYK